MGPLTERGEEAWGLSRILAFVEARPILVVRRCGRLYFRRQASYPQDRFDRAIAELLPHVRIRRDELERYFASFDPPTVGTPAYRDLPPSQQRKWQLERLRRLLSLYRVHWPTFSGEAALCWYSSYDRTTGILGDSEAAFVPHATHAYLRGVFWGVTRSAAATVLPGHSAPPGWRPPKQKAKTLRQRRAEWFRRAWKGEYIHYADSVPPD